MIDLVYYSKFTPLQWSEFKGTHLYNGYYFSNTLHIVTQS